MGKTGQWKAEEWDAKEAWNELNRKINPPLSTPPATVPSLERARAVGGAERTAEEV